MYLPKDSNQIDFELHSELVRLYVNIGDNIPNSKSANFIFIPKERESIFTIDKKEIIENFGDKLRYNNSLEGLELILGIWTDKSDNANRELFSLKIHLPDINEYNIDIIEMKKNQKSLCKPVKSGEEKYQCLLMVSYNEEDISQEKDLLVFIKSVNENSSNKIYYNFINNSFFNEFNIEKLRQNIPSTTFFEKDYLYIKLNQTLNGTYLFINIETNLPDDITIMTSLNKKEEEERVYYLNTYNQYLIQMKEDTITFEFPSDLSLYVSIENIGGKAYFSWEEEPKMVYNLRKKGAYLTLTTPYNYTKLICKKFESDSKQNGEEPGVIFIIKYYERSTSINFDNIPSYKDSEIGFINVDFPLLLYKKDINFLHNLNFVITIKNDIYEYNEEYPTSPLNIIFYLARRDLIYEYRKRLSPYNWYEFKGLYDNSFKKFHLSLPLIEYKEDIHISPEEFPTLSIYFQKNPGYENKNILKTFNIQIQYFKFNEPDFQEENIYIYGKIIYSSDVQYYRLKNEKK